MSEEKEVKNLVRRAERDLKRKLVRTSKENPRPLMSYMKSRRGNKVGVGPFKVPLKYINGKIVMNRGKQVIRVISDKIDMAEELNKTYAAVFTRDDQAKPIPEIKQKYIREDPFTVVLARGAW